ncbi:hypothetical protein MNEG_7390, partial [Monoraphidium neglectum]
MPPRARQEPKNELILQALESRRARCEALRMQSQFQYQKAIETVRAHRGNIYGNADIARYVPKLITIPIAKEIEAVLSGLKPAEVSPPSAQRLSNAAQRPALRGYAPADGSGGFAILLALFFGERRRGAAGGSMQIPQICAAAQRFCNPNVVMDPKTQHGYSGWANIKTLEGNKLVHRDKLSRQGGQFGVKKDEFQLTDKGRRVAAELVERTAGGRPAVAAAARDAGVALGGGGGGGSGGGGVAGLGGERSEEGGEGAWAAAAASPAAAGPQRPEGAEGAGGGGGAGPSASTSPFTGQGRRLGGDSGGAPNRQPGLFGWSEGDEEGGSDADVRGMGCTGDVPSDDDEAAAIAAAAGLSREELDLQRAILESSRAALKTPALATAAAARKRPASGAGAAGEAAGGAGGGRGGGRPAWDLDAADLADLLQTPAGRGRGRGRGGGGGGGGRQPLRKPLCRTDCDDCGVLAGWLRGGAEGQVVLALGSKQRLQHVQRVAQHLNTEEGGGYSLSLEAH